MEKWQKDILRKNWTLFVDDMDCDVNFLGHFIENGILKEDQMMNLLETTIGCRRNSQFLTFLMRRPDQEFQILQKALDYNSQSHLADKLIPVNQDHEPLVSSLECSKDFLTLLTQASIITANDEASLLNTSLGKERRNRKLLKQVDKGGKAASVVLYYALINTGQQTLADLVYRQPPLNLHHVNIPTELSADTVLKKCRDEMCSELENLKTKLGDNSSSTKSFKVNVSNKHEKMIADLESVTEEQIEDIKRKKDKMITAISESDIFCASEIEKFDQSLMCHIQSIEDALNSLKALEQPKELLEHWKENYNKAGEVLGKDTGHPEIPMIYLQPLASKRDLEFKIPKVKFTVQIPAKEPRQSNAKKEPQQEQNHVQQMQVPADNNEMHVHIHNVPMEQHIQVISEQQQLIMELIKKVTDSSNRNEHSRTFSSDCNLPAEPRPAWTLSDGYIERIDKSLMKLKDLTQKHYELTLNTCKQLQDKNHQLQGLNQEQKEIIKQLESKIEQKELENLQLLDVNQEKQERVEELRKLINAQQKTVQELQNTMQAQQENVDRLQSVSHEQQTSINEQKDKILSQTEAIEQLQSKNQEQQDNIEQQQSNIQELLEAIEQLRPANQKQEENIIEQQAKILNQQEAIELLQNTNQKQQEEIEQQLNKIHELEHDLQKFNQRAKSRICTVL